MLTNRGQRLIVVIERWGIGANEWLHSWIWDGDHDVGGSLVALWNTLADCQSTTNTGFSASKLNCISVSISSLSISSSLVLTFSSRFASKCNSISLLPESSLFVSCAEMLQPRQCFFLVNAWRPYGAWSTHTSSIENYTLSSDVTALLLIALQLLGQLKLPKPKHHPYEVLFTWANHFLLSSWLTHRQLTCCPISAANSLVFWVVHFWFSVIFVCILVCFLLCRQSKSVLYTATTKWSCWHGRNHYPRSAVTLPVL